MSSTAVAPAQDVFETDDDIVSEFEEGGSPAEPKAQADASGKGNPAEDKGEEPESEGAAEGAEPEVKDGAEKVSDAWREEKATLESQIAEMQSTFANIREMAKADPVLAEKLGLAPQGGSSGDWRQQATKGLDGLTPESREVMEAVLTPILARMEQLEKDLAPTRATVGKLAQATAASNFRQGLVAAKVPVENPAFQKVLKELRRDPEFQSLESRGSALAVRTAAAEWFAKQGRAAVNGDARVQLQAANSGKTGKKSGGAALAEQIVKLSGPYDAMKSYTLRAEAQKAGRPAPRIVWEDDEK